MLVEVYWEPGQLLVVPTKHSEFYAEVWSGNTRSCSLQSGDFVIYLGETKRSKHRKRTMTYVFSVRGLGWVDPRLFDQEAKDG